MIRPTPAPLTGSTGAVTYAALIRTFNSENTLPETLASLERQSLPPNAYVFVDSGSTDRTLSIVPSGSKVQHFSASKYNYSAALNIGIEHTDCDFTLIISSHTSILDTRAISYAIDLLRSRDDIGAAYFLDGLSENFRYSIVDWENFTGFNGTWNTCAIYKTELLKKRLFRPEVFSAEDQEWSLWLLNTEKKCIARIHGGGMLYRNPSKYTIRKRLTEELAVATYVKPDMTSLRNICKLVAKAVRPVSSGRERVSNILLAYHLTRMNLLRSRGAGQDKTDPQ